MLAGSVWLYSSLVLSQSFLISCLVSDHMWLEAHATSIAYLQLLAFCFDRGALTLPLTPTQFAAYTVIPVIPAEGERCP